MKDKFISFEVPRVFKPFLYPSRYKAAWGGRAAAKSHFFAGLLVREALKRPGLRAICIREVQKSLDQSVKTLIEDKIEKLKVGRFFRIVNNEIRTPGGGVITFQGMQNHTAESIKSLEGYDIAWVEEAQALSQRSLTLLRPTIRKPGSELWFSWNPYLSTDPVDRFFRGDNPPKESIIIKSNWMDNPWFPEILLEDMKMDYAADPVLAGHIWEGDYWEVSDAQVLYNKWSVQDIDIMAIIDGEAKLPNPGAILYGPYHGCDWGDTDPTVLTRCWIENWGGSPEKKIPHRRNLYIDRESWGSRVDIPDIPELFNVIPTSKGHIIRADNSMPQLIREVNKMRFKVKPAHKWPGSVEDGIKYLRGFENIFINSCCKKTIKEAKLWKYKTDKLTGDPLPILQKGNDHTWDSIRYALSPVIRPVKRAGTWNMRCL